MSESAKKVVVIDKKSETKSSTKKTAYQKGKTLFFGTGRRKNAVARIILRPGSGKFMVGDKTIEIYLGGRKVLLSQVNTPLELVKVKGQYDVQANVSGGGIAGQAGAIAHGLSRALLWVSPDFRKVLKQFGLLTRDARVKERKKYGRKKARKGFAYRKR